MTIQQIRLCLEIERQGSITRAAEQLFLSQPNVSRALRELENELGIALFERTPSGMTPTMEGQRFLREGAEIVASMERLAKGFQAPKEFSLTMATVHCHRLPHALQQACVSLEKQPVFIEVHIMSNREVLQRLNEGKAHVGLVRYPLSRGEEVASRLRKMGLHYRRWWAVKPCISLSPPQWKDADMGDTANIITQGKRIRRQEEEEWSFLPHLEGHWVDLYGEDAYTWLRAMPHSYYVDVPRNPLEYPAAICQYPIRNAEISLHWLIWPPESPHEALIRAWDSEYDHTVS